MVARHTGITEEQLLKWQKDYLQGSMMAVGPYDRGAIFGCFDKPFGASSNWKSHLAS
jgi:hypothetical protein